MSFNGSGVKSLRKKAKMSQERFAQALGVTRFTVIHWEKDRFAPPANLLDRVTAFAPDVILDAEKTKAQQKLADSIFSDYCQNRQTGLSHAHIMGVIKDPAKTLIATDRDLQLRLIAAYPDILSLAKDA